MPDILPLPETILKTTMISEKLLLEDNIRNYHFVSQAELTVPGMDDNEEMLITDVRKYFTDKCFSIKAL